MQKRRCERRRISASIKTMTMRRSRREPVYGRIERHATGVMGAPGAPPLETFRRPVKNGAQAPGAVDPS
ncbi:hypothetical protein EME01_54950 [Sinorhizobium meliloti]|nr:hypothetical protein EME01_54950 [Sinorhizobium meliloti]